MAGRYHLTPLARAQLREIKQSSIILHGLARTQRYFHDLHDAMIFAASNHKSMPKRKANSA